MKICCVVGARPQFVKAAALTRAAANCGHKVSIIHTGQHYDENMSGIFFEEMEIPKPDYHLQVGGIAQGAMTGRMMEGLEKIFLSEPPNYVVVFGDTNSTLAAALTAVKMDIPLAHIEAGLRSYNKKMPEEINRILTDHCADTLFVPTDNAKGNLIREGIHTTKISVVGDIMVDALYYYKEKAVKTSTILDDLGLEDKEYVLATIHRAESTDHPAILHDIFKSLIEIAKTTKVVIPLHPRTRKSLHEIGLLDICEIHLTVISPVGYLDMLVLEKNASIILTDSGGVQKEAYLFQVPCIILRSETEWVELTDKGYNMLLPPLKGNIVKAYHEFVTPEDWDMTMYGEGNASKKILNILLP